MTLEEALATPGRKVQTSRSAKNGDRVVNVYSVGSGGAKLLEAVEVPPAELDALIAKLKARGCELADTEFTTNIVWVITADGVEAFDKRRKQFEAVGDRSTIKDGTVVARSDYAQVFAWAAEEYTHRGVMAVLRSGEEVELVIEISLDAGGDPTYNRNDLLFDTGWCSTLGRAIASWAGTPFENKI